MSLSIQIRLVLLDGTCFVDELTALLSNLILLLDDFVFELLQDSLVGRGVGR